MVEVRFVPKSTYEAHTHNYRKLIQIGVDDDDKFGSPARVDVVDDAETVADTPVDLEAISVSVSTSPTSTPITT